MWPSLSLEREGRGRDEKRDERREEKSEVGREREREARGDRGERERGKRKEREERERERKRGGRERRGGRDESNLKNAGEAGNLQSRPGSPLGRPTSQVAGGAGAPAGGGARFFRLLFFGPFLRSIGGAQNACFSMNSPTVLKTFFSKFTFPYHLENRSYELFQNLVGFCDFP